MNAAALAADLLAWSLQAALLAGVGLALPALFRLDPPSLRLRYWQGVLLAALVAPALFRQSLGSALPSWQGDIRVGRGWLTGGLATPDASGGWTPASLILLTVGLVAALRLIRLAWGLRLLRSWKAGAGEIALPPDIAGEIQALAPRVRIRLSPVAGPLTYGWREPVILLPAHFGALAEDEQRAILEHEILHVRQRDWLFSLLEAAIGAVLWFHPGIQLVLGRIELAREQAIDRQVVRRMGARRAYLRALLAFACPPRQAGATGLPFLNRSHLRARVAQLTQEVSMSRRRAVLSTTLFVAVLFAVAALAHAAFPVGAATALSTPSALLAAKGKPVRVEGAIQKPEKISGEDPEYPDSANRVSAKGITKVDIVINENGRVENPKVASSSGRPDLDQSALGAVSTWVFKPATLDGKPIAVLFTITIRFEP